MILLLIGLIALMILGWLVDDQGYGGRNMMAIFVYIISFVGLLIYCILIYSYVAAGYKVDIINREYGTSYTQEEVFYARGVIDTIREIQRDRIDFRHTIKTEQEQ